MPNSITANVIRRHLHSIVALLALAVGSVFTPPIAAQTSSYGAEGELWSTRVGRYDDLFPAGNEVAGRNTVMSLERRSREGLETWLVPNTAGARAEEAPALVVEPTSGQVFLLWATRQGEEVAELQLTSFDGEHFGEVIEISGNTANGKTPPRLVVVRDEGREEGTTRTTVHVTWSEHEDGEDHAYYAPVILVEGEYLGWNPVVRLDSLGADPEAAGAVTATALRRPILESGTESSVVIGVPRREGSRLLTLRARSLPSELLRLADDARSHISVVGARTPDDSILSIAEEARSHISVVGARFHRGVIDYIAEQTYLEILAYGAELGPDDGEELGQQVWQRVVDSGSSLLGNERSSEELDCSVLNLGKDGPITLLDDPSDTLHQLELCTVSEHEMPELTGTLGEEPVVILSNNGRRKLIAWTVEDGLRYSLRLVDGWAEPRQAAIGDMDIDAALDLLRSSIRE